MPEPRLASETFLSSPSASPSLSVPLQLLPIFLDSNGCRPEQVGDHGCSTFSGDGVSLHGSCINTCMCKHFEYPGAMSGRSGRGESAQAHGRLLCSNQEHWTHLFVLGGDGLLQLHGGQCAICFAFAQGVQALRPRRLYLWWSAENLSHPLRCSIVHVRVFVLFSWRSETGLWQRVHLICWMTIFRPLCLNRICF